MCIHIYFCMCILQTVVTFGTLTNQMFDYYKPIGKWKCKKTSIFGLFMANLKQFWSSSVQDFRSLTSSSVQLSILVHPLMEPALHFLRFCTTKPWAHPANGVSIILWIQCDKMSIIRGEYAAKLQVSQTIDLLTTRLQVRLWERPIGFLCLSRSTMWNLD